MKLTGLSNHGLLIIAVLVAVLWGLILAERAIVRQAHQETLLLLRSRSPVPAQYQQPSFIRPLRRG